MNRREVMLGLAAMLGADLVTPLREAVAAGLDPVNLTGASLFTAAEREDVAALAETIIPATDTPGAREAGVANFIEFMLQEFFPGNDRDRFETGLAAVRVHCEAEYSRPFASLDEEGRFVVVSGLETGKVRSLDDGGKEFFTYLKQLTLFGYYTSEIGMTVERRYLPVPGEYDGAYPYENVGTLFTS
jgi:gluconate 2-dehydrogenase gamma chain